MKIKYVPLLIVILILLIEPICCQTSDSNLSKENSFSRLTTYFESKNVSATVAIIGIFGTVITVISGYYTILSWNKSKKENEVYKELFNLAQESLNQKNISQQLDNTREELKEKEGLLKNYSKEIESMQQKIYEEIPKEARRVVYEGKLYATKETLVKTYESILMIQKELDGIGTEVEIPENIKEYIESEIRPDYIVREEQSKKKNYIIYLTTASSMTPALLPYPLAEWVTRLLLAFALLFIYDILLRPYLSKKFSKNSFNIYTGTIYGSSVCSLIIFLLGFVGGLFGDWELSTFLFILAVVIFIIPFTVVYMLHPEIIKQEYNQIKKKLI